MVKVVSVQHRQIHYGESLIHYSLEYKERQTLAIEVHPDLSVHVKAPLNSPLDAIESKLLKRAFWIQKQQRKFKEYAPALEARSYVSGEGYRYLGRQYRLKIIKQPTKNIRLWRGRLEVSVPSPEDKQSIEKLVTAWFRQKAEQVFDDRYEVCCQHVAKHGIEHSGGVHLRVMAKRWGSCTKEGRIMLNPHLVSAPKDCIDYVITHELCHTIENAHSPQFFALLSRCMADWQQRKSRLNSSVEALN